MKFLYFVVIAILAALAFNLLRLIIRFLYKSIKRIVVKHQKPPIRSAPYDADDDTV